MTETKVMEEVGEVPETPQTKKRRKKRKIVSPLAIVMSVIFGIYTLILIFPYIYAFLVSISTDYEYQNQIFPQPHHFKISNYIAAVKDLSYAGTSVPAMFVNSLWYSVGTTVVGLFFASSCAYAVSKFRFPGRMFIYNFALAMMIIPVIGGSSAHLKFISMMGAYNSPWYAVVAAQTINGSFIIIVSCYDSVSWNYAEAAYIDGAGHATVYFQIMLPQVISPLCALACTDFIAAWSNAENALLYFPDLPTLATGLYLYSDVVERLYNYPVYYAGMLACMIPSIVLFSIFQDKLMDIQMGGGIKG